MTKFCTHDNISTSNKFLIVLHGQFEGYDVDVQVWRGFCEEGCPTDLTQRAVRINARIINGVDDTMRRCVRVLHGWANCAMIKGHCLCRLPGVAVTCLALLTACDRSDDADKDDCTDGVLLQHMLSRLLSFMSTGTLSFTLDADGWWTSKCDETQKVLTITVDDCILTSRMTATTTYDLYECIKFATGLDEVSVYSVPVYARMRRDRTFVALRARARCNSSIPLTLHKSFARLDGHPCIRGIHALQHDDHVEVRVWLTDAPIAASYGLHTCDTFVVDFECAVFCADAPMVRICRDMRRTVVVEPSLMTKTQAATSRDHISAPIFVRESDHASLAWYIPNYPCITCDVGCVFGDKHWLLLRDK